MVDLDTFRKRIGCLQDVQIVISSTRLIHRLQDTIGIEPLLTRDMQRTRHNSDQQATVILETHNVNQGLFQSGFRQVSINCQLVAKRATSSVGVSNVTKTHSIATSVSSIKSTIVNISANVFLGLTERHCQATCTLLGHLFVQVVIKFFLGNNVAKRISNVRVASHKTLDFRIIHNRLSLSLARHQTKRSQLHVFFVVHRRSIGVKKIRILYSVFVILHTPPRFNAGPKGLGM